MHSCEEDLAYLNRMLDEPTVYGIMRWIDQSLEEHGGYDHKYLRRIIEAFVVVNGQNNGPTRRDATSTDSR